MTFVFRSRGDCDRVIKSETDVGGVEINVFCKIQFLKQDLPTDLDRTLLEIIMGTSEKG